MEGDGTKTPHSPLTNSLLTISCLSLVGTTSAGFNLFLGGAMAEGKKLRAAQRGIAFSTVSAFIVSVLILIVGAGYHNELNNKTDGAAMLECQESGEMFRITDLACFLFQYVGQAGVVVYSVGFIAAALSSMLTTPLGAALTADSVFSELGTGGAEEDVRRNNKLESAMTVSVSVSPSLETETLLPRKLPHKIYLGIMFLMVIIATIVISANGQYCQY